MNCQTTPLDQTQRRSGVVLLVGISVLLVALGARLVYINTALRPRLLAIARNQQQGRTVIPARRGMIFDARGRVVALSRRMPDVFVDPSRVKNVDRLARELAPRLHSSASEIATKIHRRTNSRFVVLAQRVDVVTAKAVEDMRNQAVGLTERAQRTYPLGRSMAHVLGWVGRDGTGLEGIELAYEEHLCGRDGLSRTLRDARRRAFSASPSAAGGTVPPIDGGHLVLTIDAEIQRITEEALAEGIDKFEASSGVAIVMSPNNGEILAMACWPSFDPNEPVAEGSAAIRRNRALTDPVEPGSTFKPIIACGALAGGFVSPTEKIDCHKGRKRFGRRLITDTKPHGLLDIRGIITRSSNIGMGIIASRMGNEVLHETIRQFGFGERTGIEYPGESGGVVYPLHHWTSYSTTSVPIGYEVLVTPIQLTTAFAAIVNDGILLRPRLIKMLLGPDGKVLQAFDSPQIVRRAVSSEVARYVARELLVSVVEEGGGHRAKVGPYRVLGKTGTAKLLLADRSDYESGAYLSVFVGAAPVAHPQVVVLAMIRRPNPQIGYYGGTVAAPVVGTIIESTLMYLEVPPDEEWTLSDL